MLPSQILRGAEYSPTLCPCRSRVECLSGEGRLYRKEWLPLEMAESETNGYLMTGVWILQGVHMKPFALVHPRCPAMANNQSVIYKLQSTLCGIQGAVFLGLVVGSTHVSKKVTIRLLAV